MAIEASKWHHSRRKLPAAATVVLHKENNYTRVFQVVERDFVTPVTLKEERPQALERDNLTWAFKVIKANPNIVYIN